MLEIERHTPADILEKCPQRQFDKGEMIMPTGTVRDVSIYYITQGNLEVYSYSYNGRRFLVDELGENEFIGKFSQLHGCNFFSEAIALQKMSVIDLTKYKKELFANERFSLFFCRKTQRRLYHMYQQSLSKMLFTYDELLSYYFLAMSGGKPVFSVNDEYMCLKLNISRRNYFYIIKKMVERNLLERTRRGMRILDRTAMEELSSNVFAFFEGGSPRGKENIWKHTAAHEGGH